MKFSCENVYNKLINRKNEIEETLLDLGTHSIAISEYMIALEHSEWYTLIQTSEWFRIANGIKGLNYDGIRYDAAFLYCEPAYEYEIAKQELYERLVREISVFNYLYSGLECLISYLELQKSKIGKIKSTTLFLKNNLEAWHISIKGYQEIYSLCLKMQNVVFNSDSSNTELKIKDDKFTSVHGYGLRLLYMVRNKIVHGDFFFPEPLYYTFSPPLQPEIINLCSRLILFNVQMIFLAERKNEFNSEFKMYDSSIVENIFDFGDDLDEPTIDEKSYLKALHLKPPYRCEGQMLIPFNLL